MNLAICFDKLSMTRYFLRLSEESYSLTYEESHENSSSFTSGIAEEILP